MTNEARPRTMPRAHRALARRIGAACRGARRQLRLSQHDVADASGLTLDAYGRIERGERLPGLITFVALASALGTSADEMLGRSTQGRQALTFRPQAPVELSRDTRRVLRLLRRVSPSAIRMVAMVLREFEARAREARKGARKPGGRAELRAG